MIDIKKLEEYINENYAESDDSNETDADHRKLPSRNPLADFARKISGHGGMHGGMNPLSGMSPLKHPDFKILEKRMKTKKEDFISRLIYYINLKKMTPPQVYNAAGITPDCFSKILSGKTKHPTKEKIIAMAIALKLKYKEAEDLLSSAGYCFSLSKEDVIFEFCFENGPCTIDEVNEVLVYFNLEPIGGRA